MNSHDGVSVVYNFHGPFPSVFEAFSMIRYDFKSVLMQKSRKCCNKANLGESFARASAFPLAPREKGAIRRCFELFAVQTLHTIACHDPPIRFPVHCIGSPYGLVYLNARHVDKDVGVCWDAMILATNNQSRCFRPGALGKDCDRWVQSERLVL